jgi:UDP-3-O-[3-hydroxymyristoyl] glucosamine N-acyltransferase
MADSRFFKIKKRVTLQDVCTLLKIPTPQRNENLVEISGIARIDDATGTEITFLHNAKYIEDLKKTSALACVIDEKHKHLVPSTTIALVVQEPYLALALLLRELYTTNIETKEPFISKKASIAPGAVIETDCYISDNAVISSGAIIRKGTFIGSNTTILHGVEIGENSRIEANATIGYAIIGKNAHIKAGARIGQQGFGFHIGATGFTDVMQIGRVLIGEDVQIGANCTIDRGSIGDTTIGNHVRIDNMVHIAHNVEIGDYCVIAAQTGIAGSTKIGNACVFGGQVGIVGHISVGDRVTVAAQSGIVRDTEAGAKIAGSPAIRIMEWRRQTVLLRKLAQNKNTF